jgi:hypothetical protein
MAEVEVRITDMWGRDASFSKAIEPYMSATRIIEALSECTSDATDWVEKRTTAKQAVQHVETKPEYQYKGVIARPIKDNPQA